MKNFKKAVFSAIIIGFAPAAQAVKIEDVSDGTVLLNEAAPKAREVPKGRNLHDEFRGAVLRQAIRSLGLSPDAKKGAFGDQLPNRQARPFSEADHAQAARHPKSMFPENKQGYVNVKLPVSFLWTALSFAPVGLGVILKLFFMTK